MRVILAMVLVSCAATLPPLPGPKFYKPDDVVQVMKEAIPEVQKCANAAMQSEREVKDTKLIIDFSIRADGTVGDVVSQSADLHGTAWEQCIMRVVGQLLFPAAGGEDRIRFPFKI